MSKNAFTPDGGPHRPDRVRNVSDGLKRLGEFEAAEMLANYAALLREREGRNTWEQTVKLIGDDIDSTESLIEAGCESAKAGVTSQMRATACDAYDKEMVGHGETANPVAMRAALEAVAPMLASARVPDAMEVDGSPFQTWDHDTYKEYGYALGWNACRAVMLAVAPKPETEE